MRLAPLIALALAALCIAPATALRITEVQPNPDSGPEYVELWLSDEGGNLTINDTYASDTVAVPANTTGPVLIVPNTAGLGQLPCPVLSLESPIGNGLANSGDAITVTLGAQTDSFSYSSSQHGKSYDRCPNCSLFELADPTPCVVSTESAPSGNTTGSANATASGTATGTGLGGTNSSAANETSTSAPCEPPTIEAAAIQQERIEYRIRSGEAYEYWIEDAFGTVVRERAASSSSAVKRYTPEPQHEDETYLIRAASTCGSAQIAVGFVTPSLPSCVPTQDQVIAAITDSLATQICRPDIEQAAQLEADLAACRNPEPAMTSFYTLARTPSDSYAYRSTAKANATYYACAAFRANATNGSISAQLRDRDLADGVPLLVAFENDTVVDARFGAVPSFAGRRSNSTSDSVNATRAANETTSSGTVSGAENATSGGASGAPLDAWTGAEPRYVRAIRALWNRVRTSRSARSAEPWLVPISFGIAGLAVALERT